MAKLSQFCHIFHCMRDQFDVSCCVSSACLVWLHDITQRHTVKMCAKYKLMEVEYGSFFALSYSFQNINKFDGLIRINRPNSGHMELRPGTISVFLRFFFAYMLLLNCSHSHITLY